MNDHIEALFERPAVDWWFYVPCVSCNAPRRQPCQATLGPARQPHVARIRSAYALHSTLWLLTHDGGKFAHDVLGEPAEEDECYQIVVSAFGLNREDQEALFDRVADAAHARDEMVTCSGGSPE